ncbi:MAG: helix-turn-helix domain-containing protein [Ekhidna sp.]
MAKKNRNNLSYVGENIKKIRQAKKLSQADFSQIFNLARASVGAYEEGRSEPKIEMLISMANYFGISIDALLTKKLTISEIFKFDSLNEKLDEVHQLKGRAISKADFSVNLVRVDGYLDFVVHHDDRNYLDNLEFIGFPVLKKRPEIAFEMNGMEMVVGSHGVRHGDILYANEIYKKEVNQLQNRLVVIMTAKELIIRRITLLEDNEVALKADDIQFDQKKIKLESIVKLFKITGIASEYIPAPSETDERLSRIEEELKKMKE